VRRSPAIDMAASTIALLLSFGSSPAAAAPDPIAPLQQTVHELTAPPKGTAPARTAAGSAMTGRFVISSGSCTSGAVPKGSYFSMRDPSGGAVNNGNSPCTNQAATPLKAGTEGLTPGRMQPFPASPGNADAIVNPTNFFSSPFAVGTQSPDKQSGKDAAPPQILDSAGRLSGEIRSFQAFYNGAYYNQGAPKPDGSTPGSTTTGVSGTYDSSSGAFTLEWKSTIVGGAFNNFTGVWHLEGVYRDSGSGASGGSAPLPSGGGSPSTSGSGSSSTSSGSAPASGTGSSLANTGLGTGPMTLTLLLLACLAALVRRISLPARSH
jgi:hypothetical protein